MNLWLKVLLNWQPRKIDELIDKLYELDKLQMVDIRRSLCGSGNYIMSNTYSKTKVTKLQWNSKSEEDKNKLFQKFLSTGMSTVPVSVISTDGTYTVNKFPKLAKKPCIRLEAGCTESKLLSETCETAK